MTVVTSTDLNDQISVIDSEIAKKQYPGKSRLEVTVTLQVTEQSEVRETSVKFLIQANRSNCNFLTLF